MLKCKYKKFDNERFCQVIHGECQFILCKYGPECPIFNAYIDWDAYIVEELAKNNGGVAVVDSIATADVFGEDDVFAEVDVLDIVVDDTGE